MIYNQWYAILESGEVKKGRIVGVTRLGERLVLWRTGDGRVVCLKDRCAHRGAALSAGRIEGKCVECPFHGFRYDSTGRCTLIPAQGRGRPVPENFKVRSYAVREAYGFIWMYWGDRTEDLPAIPFFEDLDDTFSYATFKDPWPVHDVVHLPFVHRTTIGRGGKTIVNGPRVDLGDDTMRIWMHNEVDRGQEALKPEQIRESDSPVVLIFRFPHVWQNRISDRVRATLCFVPVDESNTLIYMRYYHRLTPVPGVRQLITFFGKLFSIVILRQDKRVVVTQRPVKTRLKMGENLVQGDLPIAIYRRRREELLAASPPPGPD
jgi:phenylpropionate dioxygenase-like ring-hydroxylating dioxygenase large terminal subunit